jgi:hypothetical protein
MALPIMDRRNFRHAAVGILAVASRLVDWVGLLESYSWGGADWRAGLAARAAMHRRLVDVEDDDDFSSAIAAIAEWGGLRHLSGDELQAVRRSLPVLNQLGVTAGAPPPDLYTHRIAIVSKVYAMYSPFRWVIYDCRVARGLAVLVRMALRAHAVPDALRFPQPQGRTGSRPDGFPRLGARADAQARLGFVYASWLAQDLAVRIGATCPDPSGRDARHVEMALFMLGRPDAQTTKLPSEYAAPVLAAIDGRLEALEHEIAKLEAARAALTGR